MSQLPVLIIAQSEHLARILQAELAGSNTISHICSYPSPGGPKALNEDQPSLVGSVLTYQCEDSCANGMRVKARCNTVEDVLGYIKR